MDGGEDLPSDRTVSPKNCPEVLEDGNHRDDSEYNSEDEAGTEGRVNGHDESYSHSEHDENQVEDDSSNQQVNGYSKPSRSSSGNSSNRDHYTNGGDSCRGQNGPEHLELTDWIEQVKNILKSEHEVLKQIEFKDYQNLDELKETLSDTVRICKEYDDHVAVLSAGMGDLRVVLKDLNSTIDKKLSQEGLKGWLRESSDDETGEKYLSYSLPIILDTEGSLGKDPNQSPH